MQDTIHSGSHTVNMTDRENLSITGVTDVMGFDEQTVNVQTPMGNLIVKGESLHISKLSLDSSEVVIDGRVNSLQYLGDSRQKGFVSKLFR